MKVFLENNLRKAEYKEGDPEFNETLDQAFSIYRPNCEVIGVSTNGQGLFGLYMMEKPSNSPVDLSGVDLDPACNSLLSFKVSKGQITAKVYKIGNIKNVDIGKAVVGTGEYVSEDKFTVYYHDDKRVLIEGDKILFFDEENGLEEVGFGFCYKHGFSAVTFENGEIVSGESVYVPS